MPESRLEDFHVSLKSSVNIRGCSWKIKSIKALKRLFCPKCLFVKNWKSKKNLNGEKINGLFADACQFWRLRLLIGKLASLFQLVCLSIFHSSFVNLSLLFVFLSIFPVCLFVSLSVFPISLSYATLSFSLYLYHLLCVCLFY